MLFYLLYHDILSLASLKITVISFVTWFYTKPNHLLGFKIQSSVRITEGLDNGNSDNQGSTVCIIQWVEKHIRLLSAAHTID